MLTFQNLYKNPDFEMALQETKSNTGLGMGMGIEKSLNQTKYASAFEKYRTHIKRWNSVRSRVKASSLN